MKTRHNRQRGVTMLELVVVLAIGAILLIMAVPNFVKTKYHYTLQAAALTLVEDLRKTQATAIKTGATTALIFSGAATTNPSYQQFCSANSCTPVDTNGAVTSVSFDSSGYVSAISPPLTVTMISCVTGEQLQVQLQRTGRIQTSTPTVSHC